MSTKQLQFQFQVDANDGVSANVTVQINGVQKFSGAVAHTSDTMTAPTFGQNPHDTVTVDVDVPNGPLPFPPQPGDNPTYHGTWESPTPVDVVITIQGGGLYLQGTFANYAAQMSATSPYVTSAGTDGTYVLCRYSGVPTWSSGATPSQRGYVEGDVPPNSPSFLFLLDGESVTFSTLVSMYNSAV